MRRGDNIPSVSEYAHWNEDAQRVWYEENKYDMEHADEEIGDDDDRFYADDDGDYEDEEWFATREEAEAFFETQGDADGPRQFGDRWMVAYLGPDTKKKFEQLKKAYGRRH